MISVPHLLAFLPVCALLVAVPGPSVLFTIGRALSAGRRSALLTVLGNGCGLLIQAIALAVGLGALLAAASGALIALKIVGGAYLIWLGVQALRQHEDATANGTGATARSAFAELRAGFVVGITNPKTLVFLAALLPQFVPATAFAPAQLLALGLEFALVAIAGDSVWALAAGSARAWFAQSPGRLAWVRRSGGVVLMGLGVYSIATPS